MDKPPDARSAKPEFHLPAGSPVFLCPSCECPLQYNRTTRTGGGAEDMSDFYDCPAGCGAFEYDRHRHRLSLVAGGYVNHDA